MPAKQSLLLKFCKSMLTTAKDSEYSHLDYPQELIDHTFKNNDWTYSQKSLLKKKMNRLQIRAEDILKQVKKEKDFINFIESQKPVGL